MSVRIEYLLLSPTTNPIAIPAHGDLIGTPASINASEPPQTVRPRRRPVRFQNSRHQPHRVWKFRFGRQQARQRAFCQSTVTDFTSSRSTQKLYFANAERWEFVVQQEALELILLKEQIEPLHVFLSSQR